MWGVFFLGLNGGIVRLERGTNTAKCKLIFVLFLFLVLFF